MAGGGEIPIVIAKTPQVWGWPSGMPAPKHRPHGTTVPLTARQSNVLLYNTKQKTQLFKENPKCSL